MIPKEFDKVRIDKWLWAVRICKSRTIAEDLCSRGKVKIDGLDAKPSRDVKTGQQVVVKREGVSWTYKVLKCIEQRVDASTASLCKDDLTSQSEIDRLKMIHSQGIPLRLKGTGRPTKKDRRQIEKLDNGP